MKSLKETTDMESKCGVATLNNTIDYSPRGYSVMSVFYNIVFTDGGNINNAIQYDDTAIYAMYKKSILMDIELWLKWHYEETLI